MKTALIVLALISTLPAASAPASACDRDGNSYSLSDCESPVRWTDRQAGGDTRLAITTEDGGVTLILTDDVMAMQLSDRVMHKIHRKLHDERREREDNSIGQAIKVAVLSSVSTLLDHSAEVSIDDVRDVEYRNGRLVIISEDGKRLFRQTKVNDRNVLSEFSDDDARQFVREFRRVKYGARQRG